MTINVTDGHLPCPYGREMTGYAVANLPRTIAKAQAAGVAVLVKPYTAEHREVAMLQFSGELPAAPVRKVTNSPTDLAFDSAKPLISLTLGRSRSPFITPV